MIVTVTMSATEPTAAIMDEVFYVDRKSSGKVYFESGQGGAVLSYRDDVAFWTGRWDRHYHDRIDQSDMKFSIGMISIDDLKKVTKLVTPSTMHFMLEALTTVANALDIDEYGQVDMCTMLHICMELGSVERISNTAFMVAMLRARSMRGITMKAVRS